MIKSLKIDDVRKAKEMAMRFVGQHYSVGYASAVLKGDVWKISVTVGLPNKKIKEVSIDAESGNIKLHLSLASINKQ